MISATMVVADYNRDVTICFKCHIAETAVSHSVFVYFQGDQRQKK